MVARGKEIEMPQVIIHASPSISLEDKKELLKKIKDSIPSLLSVPETIGQVVLYTTSEDNRCTHPSRDNAFIIVEVMMYPGRTKKVKQDFQLSFDAEHLRQNLLSSH